MCTPSCVTTRRRCIHWLLSGPREQASSRLHGFLIHEWLQRSGWESRIVFSPSEWIEDIPDYLQEVVLRTVRPGDLVVLQKLHGPRTSTLMSCLRAEAVAIVFVDCDLPLKLTEAKLASLVICSSETLAELYRCNCGQRVVALREMFEISRPPVIRRNGLLRVVWFGCMDMFKAAQVKAFRSLLSRNVPDCQLVVVSFGKLADRPWNLPGSWDTIASCDIAVITGSDSKWSSYKSANRVIQAMALGLPVLAYPLPSYRAVIKHNRNGLLCTTEVDWIRGLNTLRDPDERFTLATNGYRYACRYFSPEVVGEEWRQEFETILIR